MKEHVFVRVAIINFMLPRILKKVEDYFMN